jgi:protein associated with RNAse G/E
VSERVRIRYTKWDGSLHWHFGADVIDRDRHGTWVVVRPGGSYGRADDPSLTSEFGFVVLIPDNGWWTAYFNAVPRGSSRHLVYVDINTPPTWDGDLVTMIDLDLDVTMAPEGAARVIDEDEFDDHRIRWSYPPDVVDRVRTAAARVATAIDLGTEPFLTTGPGHVARVLGWAHGTIRSVTHPDGHLGLVVPHRIVSAHAGHLTAKCAIDGAIHAVTIVPDDSGLLLLGGASIGQRDVGDPISVWIDPDEATFDVA